MTELELRESLAADVHWKMEHPFQRRKSELVDRAQVLQREFREALTQEQRDAVKMRYMQLDRELGQLNRAIASAGVAGDRQRPVAAQATYAANPRHDTGVGRPAGWTEHRERAARDRGAQIRQELEHLLNNYYPASDLRIQALIERWRTSGDPSFDPSVRSRFQNLKQKVSASKSKG